MKAKIKCLIITTTLCISFLLIVTSCTKDDTSGENNEILYGTVTDIDGNQYKTVTIGTQTWMAENLKVTKYNDGTEIPNVTDLTSWINLTTGAVCTYNNTTNADTINNYGRLYNWYAVNTGKLCPTGWHVPSDAEWTILNNYLLSNAGGKLKERGTIHWISPNEGATNETGFTALPSGGRSNNGTFIGIGSSGYWWCSNERGQENAYNVWLSCNDGNLYDYGGIITNDICGFSIRCLKN